MSEPLCKPCEQRGVKRKAHRMSNPPMCNECYADSLGEARPTNVVLERLAAMRKERQAAMVTETEKPKEKIMPKTLEVNWRAVQADRDAGVGIKALMEKYGAAAQTIYARTTTPKRDPVARPKVTAAKATPKPLLIPKRIRTGSGYDNVLDELRTKRDQLNSAITAIEALG